MKQLFKKLVASETGASIDRHGDMLVAKYKKHGKAKQIMAAEEIQALIDERDDALHTVMEPTMNWELKILMAFECV